jgi:hypothetical protein
VPGYVMRSSLRCRSRFAHIASTLSSIRPSSSSAARVGMPARSSVLISLLPDCLAAHAVGLVAEKLEGGHWQALWNAGAQRNVS